MLTAELEEVMKVDVGISGDLSSAAEEARRAERLGYDGLKIAELAHDPFLPLTIAAEHTEHIELVTSVAVALLGIP